MSHEGVLSRMLHVEKLEVLAKMPGLGQIFEWSYLRVQTLVQRRSRLDPVRC